MKKTISVNLNHQIFNLDIDAYSKLNDYLSAIKKHFDKSDYSEIIDDIESRISEKFTEILGKNKKVIQIENVNQVIQEMGSVNDITGDDNDDVDQTDKTDKASSTRKKLYRNMDSKMIAGVASGLACYFGIRSLFVRLIFIILFINSETSWLSILFYIICWILVPKTKNSFEKLEMKGRPATLDELQNVSDDTDNLSVIEKKTQNFFQKIFSFCFRSIKFCLKWGLKLTGFFCFIFNIILIVCLVVGLVLVYFNQLFPYIDLTFFKSISSPALEIGFISLGLFLLMPIIFCLDLSDDLMQLKWNISFKKVLLMIVVWIVSLITFAATVKITYPQYQSQLTAFVDHFKYFDSIDETNSQTINIKNIQSVDISNVRQVELVQSDENVLIITGNQHQIEELNTKISSDSLSIQGKTATWIGCRDCLDYVSSIRVEVHAPNISNIKLDNTDATLEAKSGDIKIDLIKKTGLKIDGKLNKISLNAGPDTVTNTLDATINQIDSQLTQSILKTGANIINIKGDSQSLLIYKNQPQIISQKGDESQREKYILSEDREKLIKTLEKTVINLGGISKTFQEFNWSPNLKYQKDSNFYHIYTFVKLPNTTDVYVLWLIEKDGIIALNKSFKISNWEDVHYLSLINDKFITINGQVYGPELKEETKKIYIDKIKNQLEIYSPESQE